MKENNIYATDDDIKNIVKNLEVRQISKRPVKRSIPIICPHSSGSCYQIDILFFDNLKFQNDRYIGMMNLINITSKYSYSKKLKNKSAKEVSEKFQEMLSDIENKKERMQRSFHDSAISRNRSDESDRFFKIIYLYSDNGKEFNNNTFKKIVDKNEIRHIMFIGEDNHNKLSIVERFNRTLRELFMKYMNQNDKTRWVDVHEDILQNYNNSIHSSTKMKPKDVTPEQQKKLNEDKIILAQNIVKDIPKLVVGDKVRKVIKKKLFEKDIEKYSKQIYEVVEVQGLSHKIKNKSGTILKPFYHINTLMKVDENNLLKIGKNIQEENSVKSIREKNKVRRKLVKEKLGEVDENNKIIIPKRLRTKNEVRMIKIPDSIRKSQNIPKDVIGKTKSGTLVKTRRRKKSKSIV